MVSLDILQESGSTAHYLKKLAVLKNAVPACLVVHRHLS